MLFSIPIFIPMACGSASLASLPAPVVFHLADEVGVQFWLVSTCGYLRSSR